MEDWTLELSGSGYGYGYGDGSGYGSGSGYGDGYGSGYGYGSGSGYGDGYGSGSGSGSGDGSGYGSGYGSGSGSGYGYGSGSGDGDGYGDTESNKSYFAGMLVKYAADGVRPAFWRCTQDNRPANGGRGTVAREGVIEEIAGPLAICTSKALHGTVNPLQWKGESWWIVLLHEPVQQHDDKLGSLKRTFVKNLGKCPFAS